MNTYSKNITYTALALFGVIIVSMLTSLINIQEPFVRALEILILVIFFIHYKRFFNISLLDKNGYKLIIVFIAWLVFGFVRAAFYADGYWMWKQIFGQLLTTFFYVVILVSTNVMVVQRYYRLYWLFFLPLVGISFFIDETPLQLNYVPYSTLMLFFILIPPKKRIMLIGVMFLYFTFNYQRNDLIKILITTLIGLYIAYFYHRIFRQITQLVHFFLMAIPFVLLLMATSGTFNIFKMDEYVEGDYKQKITSADGIVEENLKADTRTLLYENVFYTVNKYDSWIFGRSTAFGDEGVNNFWGKSDLTGLEGRYGNEVGILNILLWYGLIGVFIYFLIYLRASYIAIYKSRNRYVKGVGLYVAFLWAWSFIWEKQLFETFFMMDLVMLGLCFSNKFRSMTDYEVKIWVKYIFTKVSFGDNTIKQL